MKVKTTKEVSSLDKHIKSMSSELQKLGLEIVGTPEFGRQSAFTLCKIRVKKIKGTKEMVGYGMTLRNLSDAPDHELGKYTALQRALFAKGNLSITGQLSRGSKKAK